MGLRRGQRGSLQLHATTLVEENDGGVSKDCQTATNNTHPPRLIPPPASLSSKLLLVVTLRDPVKRMFSEFYHNHYAGPAR